tara:strand:- start:7 stop:504 length:498 start_codon:yes stop_codon:yes gene_type:complete
MSGIIGVGPNMRSGIIGAFPTDHVINYKRTTGVGRTYNATNSWNYAHPNLVMTYTAKSASSLLLLTANYNYKKEDSGYFNADFYKNASDFTETYNLSGLTYGITQNSQGGGNGFYQTFQTWLDTANTTNEITYKITTRSNDSGNCVVGYYTDGNLMQFTVTELAV